MKYRDHRVALVVPCHNEGITIYNTVTSFKEAMPELELYVFDNSSKDNTSEEARRAGAEVIFVKTPGKGNVVRRIFADVDADIYVMTDGDDTYEAAAVKKLVDKLIDDKLDMVVGCRKVAPEIAELAYRSGHQWGNKMLTGTVMKIFGGQFTDMLSGYRVFSRRYAKSFPALAQGFETETELTVHALELRMPYGEVMTEYSERPEGSESKLSTYKDGFRILNMIVRLFMREKPVVFFGIIASLFALLSMLFGMPVIDEFLETGLVPRLPTALLAASLMMIAIACLFAGLVLDGITTSRQEIKRLFYLNTHKS
ncbi:glycosyltransferase family 2 protein [Haemophilus sp. HMSC068C11]|jgi:glycosyltransferase, group 2 family|uniref:glycosyltransferase family 2 protein n=1 Tax=Haemophilus sp. HMSC068C11 TaxID=1739522 RepID=UPI0008A437B3|nr:glycosyltransferase family 2 protein [Haemophilus sp. HMSC068C11]OFO65916.1 glycosyl transferase [Haemophilus sp. HMSC068C11]